MELTDIENLLFNISAGLQYEDLTYREKELLKEKFGEKWETKVYPPGHTRTHFQIRYQPND